MEDSSKTRRVLMVPSAYAPAMIADMHRIRMLAWELPALGWQVEVLTPGKEFQHPSCLDPDSESLFAPDARVHEVRESFAWFFSMLTMRSICWRAMWPLYLRGRQILSTSKIDLIYISTTNFPLFILGRLWQSEFRVPYVLDFHDPWVKEKSPYQTTPHVVKARISAWLARFLERFAVGRAGGLTAVSDSYLQSLVKRYASLCPPWQEAGKNAVIPFGVSARDFDDVRNQSGNASPSQDANHIVINYVGAGGGIMARSFGLICRTLAALRNSGDTDVERIRIRLFGTTYGWREGDPKVMEGIAMQCGVGDLVSEFPGRVTYRQSIEILLSGDGALLLGVDDLGYMPSKMFGYALSGKPLLACLRLDSSGFQNFQSEPSLGNLLGFDHSGECPVDVARSIVRRFLDEASRQCIYDRRDVLAQHSSLMMASKHADLFSACIAAST